MTGWNRVAVSYGSDSKSLFLAHAQGTGDTDGAIGRKDRAILGTRWEGRTDVVVVNVLRLHELIEKWN